MYKKFFLALACCGAPVFLSTVSASQIQRLDVATLETLATHIVIGEVIAVTSNQLGQDDVSVSIHSILKGRTATKQFSIQLQTTGVKDFDPKLKRGDIAVFFLKSLGGGRAEKAYHGSIAQFNKPHFTP